MREWVHQKDSAYKWQLESEGKEEGCSVYLIKLTSQSWREASEVENPIWSHWLKVVVPEGVESNTTLLFISGAGSGEERLKKASSCVISWAKEANSVVCEIGLVFSGLIGFKADSHPNMAKFEDGLVAYTWDKYLNTGDKTWPLQMPMTKAVIKAMDSIEAFSRKHLSFELNKFVVTGLSKRGWASWLTAAHDSRVVAVMPMVIDLLNLRESFAHQFDVYGKWASAIKDYEEIDLAKWAFTKEFSNLLDLVEPFQYREHLKMPKYIINSAGDEFFLPDSSQFYFKELLEPKYLRYVPNCPHNLFKSENAIEVAGAFYQMVAEKKQLPQFCWSQKHPHQIEIECTDLPIEMNFWQAINPERRDFRFREVGAIWKKMPITLQKNGTYTIDLICPEKGWGACFVEVKYPSEQKVPLIFTTDVYVLTKEKGR